MKAILTLLISSFMFLNANAQIENTWAMTDVNGNVFNYYQFDGTTISYSFNQSSYAYFAYYFTSGDTIRIVDFAGGCSPDTAIYTYSITNDTLRLNVVVDNCVNQRAFFTNHYGVLVTPTSIAFHQEDIFNLTSANPSVDGRFSFNLFKEAKAEVYDITGKVLMVKDFLAGANELDLSQQCSSMFIIKLITDNGVPQIKLQK